MHLRNTAARQAGRDRPESPNFTLRWPMRDAAARQRAHPGGYVRLGHIPASSGHIRPDCCRRRSRRPITLCRCVMQRPVKGPSRARLRPATRSILGNCPGTLPVSRIRDLSAAGRRDGARHALPRQLATVTSAPRRPDRPSRQDSAIDRPHRARPRSILGNCPGTLPASRIRDLSAAGRRDGARHALPRQLATDRPAPRRPDRLSCQDSWIDRGPGKGPPRGSCRAPAASAPSQRNPNGSTGRAFERGKWPRANGTPMEAGDERSSAGSGPRQIPKGGPEDPARPSVARGQAAVGRNRSGRTGVTESSALRTRPMGLP